MMFYNNILANFYIVEINSASSRMNRHVVTLQSMQTGRLQAAITTWSFVYQIHTGLVSLCRIFPKLHDASPAKVNTNINALKR
jgi:hypothetical protein